MGPDERLMGRRSMIRFTPWNLVGAMIILVPTVVLAVALAAVIPAEDVPRVSKLKDGSTSYHFRSLRESVLPPVVAILFVTFTAVAAHTLLSRRDVDQDKRRIGIVMRVFWYSIATIGCAMVIWCLLVVIVIWPYSQIRTVVVRKDTVVVESLFRSWHLPRTNIIRAQLCRRNVLRRQHARVNVWFEIEQRNGAKHRTTELSFENADPALRRCVKFVNQLETHLKEQR